MQTSQERKQRYVKDILKAHPFYMPETFIAQQAAKRLLRLPEQTVFYLWHLLGINEKGKGDDVCLP